MGEIRFVGTGKTCGYPYLVCKKKVYTYLKKALTKTVFGCRLDLICPSPMLVSLKLHLPQNVSS